MKRAELNLPLCGMLIGGLATICWAMVYRQSEFDRTRVPLDNSLPYLMLGLQSGSLIGCGLRWVGRSWPRFHMLLTPVVMIALAGGIAGPFGWLARDHLLDESGAEAIGRAAAWGAAVGFGVWAVGRSMSALRRPAIPDGPRVK